MRDGAARSDILSLKADVAEIDEAVLLLEQATRDIANDQILLGVLAKDSANAHLVGIEAFNRIIDRIEDIEVCLNGLSRRISLLETTEALEPIHGVLVTDIAKKPKSAKKDKADKIRSEEWYEAQRHRNHSCSGKDSTCDDQS